ncbi:MBL fold metallo-hydrolase [Brevundimonas terrae]|uniref:MBL fold metallo-hydrolase n=1 Tax=Brevundimonas terrae TaxID=363631 RepID=A0ABN0YG61_9CAUL|nr:MBL fold metallo-hydrolase [Brevundimonas terrae]NIJ26877.1 glyoxylase-like metal-dependent hydrolase (beta-lactamase superfamily II) [Brevundimonas terrae]
MSQRRYFMGMNQQTAPIGVLVSPVTPLQQNCTIVWCAKTLKAAVIDPGASAEALYAEIQRRGLTLEAIWITHGHLDHAGGAQDLQQISGVEIIGPHKADLFWIEAIPEQGLKWGLPDARSFTPTRWLENGDVLSLGETRWEVYHCPGHTPGHVIFFNREARFAQVGDVLFKGSVGRTDFPQSSHEDLVNSIVGRLWSLGDDVTFIPGHGPHSTFGHERRSNPFVGDAVVNSAKMAGNISGPS